MATEAQLAEKARKEWERSSALEPPTRARPPPLPPRADETQETQPRPSPADLPPAYNTDDARRSELISEQWRSNDPRPSSADSLAPSRSRWHGRDGRRTLLLVYIHGFMGNEASFQSFPAHVHNLLTISLAGTHVVHTKIYPKYKSRKVIEFARDDFSNWLSPHEGPSTDVVLLGHSMGGILAAEVALLPPHTPATGQRFRHRILGTMSLDTPFLGIHPGVVASGLGSLFRPAPDPPGKASTSGENTPLNNRSAVASSENLPTPTSEVSSQMSPVTSVMSNLATLPTNDPNYDRPFPNDVRLPEHKGWSGAWHFINKYAEGSTLAAKFTSLSGATQQYLMSHLEFGGCLADYPGLRNRYDRLRALEDVDELAGRNELGYRVPLKRVRFINYYTASTGRPKPPKLQPVQTREKDSTETPFETPVETPSETPTKTPTDAEPRETNVQGEESQSVSQGIAIRPTLPQLTVDVQAHESIAAQMKHLGESSGVENDVQDAFQEPSFEMRHIDSEPIQETAENISITSPVGSASISTGEEVFKPVSTQPALPPIPEMPFEPPPINLEAYTDKDTRKIAEKEHKRVMKGYQQALKDRENAIKDRKKLLEKREKKERQEIEKQLKLEEKQRIKEEKEEQKRHVTINPEPKESASTAGKEAKPKKDRKFCMLPASRGGRRDKCWIRVYMEGVDEVGAHCGLFFPGPQYESLVGDVGERVEKWVQDDAQIRAVLEAAISR